MATSSSPPPNGTTAAAEERVVQNFLDMGWPRQYRVQRSMGQDSSGSIYEASRVRGPDKDQPVLVKSFHPSIFQSAERTRQMLLEIDVTSRAGLRCALPLRGVLWNKVNEPTLLITVNDWASTTLQALLNAGHSFSKTELTELPFQLLSGVYFAHKAGVVHGRLHPECVVLVENRATRTLSVKLADFSEAQLLSDSATAQRRPALSPSVDVLGCGCILAKFFRAEGFAAISLRPPELSQQLWERAVKMIGDLPVEETAALEQQVGQYSGALSCAEEDSIAAFLKVALGGALEATEDAAGKRYHQQRVDLVR
eukprot:RCo022072